MISGDVGPLTGKQIKKFFGAGEVWIDDCGAYHADACNVYLVCDAEPTCPQKPDCPEACPDEPVCPTECPEDPVCPEKCPEEPACPEECELRVTYFEGVGTFDVTACPNPDHREAIMKQTCAYNLSKGGRVQFRHNWDVFGEGINVNHLNSVVLADGTWYMWGTNVLEFCGVTLTGYMTGMKTPDNQLIARYINYADDMFVIWDFVGDLFTGNVTGAIIEGCDVDGFACAWPEETWQCGSEVTPFTGWAEPAFMPPYVERGNVTAATEEAEFWEGTSVKFYHYWNSSSAVEKLFGNGTIINSYSKLISLTEGTQLYWGSHTLTFENPCGSDITLTGSMLATRYADRSMQANWVSAGDGYLVIWYFDSTLPQQDYGVIIEL
jgi:hypothetical protein